MLFNGFCVINKYCNELSQSHWGERVGKAGSNPSVHPYSKGLWSNNSRLDLVSNLTSFRFPEFLTHNSNDSIYIP